MKAFLLSWLSQLNCLVFNRPTPLCLSGPSWRPEQWTYAAAQLVGWVEQSETHHPAAGVVMGFGYRLYLSYTDYAQGVYQGDRPVKLIG
jgi:hypothetical protein